MHRQIPQWIPILSITMLNNVNIKFQDNWTSSLPIFSIYLKVSHTFVHTVYMCVPPPPLYPLCRGLHPQWEIIRIQGATTAEKSGRFLTQDVMFLCLGNSGPIILCCQGNHSQDRNKIGCQLPYTDTDK